MSRFALISCLAGAGLALGLPGAALAQDAETAATPAPVTTLAGLWDLRIDGTTIFRFEIIPMDGGGWRGRWSRPDSFNSNGDAFGNLRGPVKTSDSMIGNAIFELVELGFDDPRPGAVPDIFRFRQTGPDTAEMLYVGTPLAPYRLVRATVADPLGNWTEGRVYRRPPAAPRPAVAAVPVPQPVAPATPGDRVIIGPQIRFLDLTPRPPETPAPAPEPEPQPAEAQPAAATSAPAPAPAPAPAAAPAAAPSQPRVDEGFLDGL